jgi:hypothetical protein
MKTIMLFITAALFAISASAQTLSENSVPAAVKAAFKRDYPSQTPMDGNWVKKGNNYCGHYTTVEEAVEVEYDKNGNLVEREKTIELAALPGSAKSYIDKTVPGKTITAVYLVTDKNGNVSYEAVVEETGYRFDTNGTYMSRNDKERTAEMKKY